uniref:AP2/ERF domain-containing protein n=1 Tax=Lactuca sativa TaxID=4236 RepID=A0A9R1URF0_LACSA|nr:hypothetical protein LSAT_V11C800436740 [Lactuca sativa]
MMHRLTRRYEAHLWDKESWNQNRKKKGKQRAYDEEEAAAHTYDLAALKYWGPETTLNFPPEMYKIEMEEMQKMSKEEYLAVLRRNSSGFSRGVSKFRGVASINYKFGSSISWGFRGGPNIITMEGGRHGLDESMGEDMFDVLVEKLAVKKSQLDLILK